MLFVIRHGETDLNAARVVQMPDTPLSERGRDQARLLAMRLARAGVERVLVSDHARARMTADAVVDATNAPLVVSELLRERSFGDIRGTPYSELGVDIFASDYVPPGGESWAEFDERVARAWQDVRSALDTVSGNLAVVTHGLVVRSLVRQFFDMRGAPEVTQLHNTGVTIVQREPPYGVERVNCVEHLRGDGPDDGTAPV